MSFAFSLQRAISASRIFLLKKDRIKKYLTLLNKIIRVYYSKGGVKEKTTDLK